MHLDHSIKVVQIANSLTRLLRASCPEPQRSLAMVFYREGFVQVLYLGHKVMDKVFAG